MLKLDLGAAIASPKNVSSTFAALLTAADNRGFFHGVRMAASVECLRETHARLEATPPHCRSAGNAGRRFLE